MTWVDAWQTGLLCYIAALVTGMYMRGGAAEREPAELGAEAETTS
jgi:hypothetical protein